MAVLLLLPYLMKGVKGCRGCGKYRLLAVVHSLSAKVFQLSIICFGYFYIEMP
jgi:hypothetical protein